MPRKGTNRPQRFIVTPVMVEVSPGPAPRAGGQTFGSNLYLAIPDSANPSRSACGRTLPP